VHAASRSSTRGAPRREAVVWPPCVERALQCLALLPPVLTRCRIGPSDYPIGTLRQQSRRRVFMASDLDLCSTADRS
jgi:hypothetical protein